MGIKEIITYVSGIIGLCIVCGVRMHFSKRQQTTPDNTYTKEENIILKVGYGLCIIALILAAIPIY